MVGTNTTIASNNKIINCNCNYNSFNGILLENISYNAIQECTCNYNLVNSYTGSSSTVQNITVTGAGIRLNTSNNNTIEGCICNYNALDCLSSNTGTTGIPGSSGGQAAVTNCTLAGAGIYLGSSSGNYLTSCACAYNISNNMCSNLGGAGIVDTTNSNGNTGACSILGAGIFIDNASMNNNITACESTNNLNANMCSNIGGASSSGLSGGGAGVGGGGGGAGVGTRSSPVGGGGGAGVGGDGGGGNGGVAGAGTCSIQGGGIYAGNINNTVDQCTCLYNITDNLSSNTGSAGGVGGSGGGAGVGGGGAGVDIPETSPIPVPGGVGTCSIQGGGIYIVNSNNAIQCCQCDNNIIGNMSYNISGNNSGSYGGAGVGGGGYSTAGSCFITGGGIYLASNNNIVQGCQCNTNNVSNLSTNTGGSSGGAGVGSGSYSGAGNSVSCSVIGGGIYITGINNSIQGCQCNANNTSNLSSNTAGTGGSPAGVGQGAGNTGPLQCYIAGGGICVAANNNDVASCQAVANSVGNLLNNSSVTPSGGSVLVCADGAGIYFGAASCNMVNGCDLTANVTCGIQLGSPYLTANNVLSDNLIMDCTVNGSTACAQSTLLDGIVSYATTGTNIVFNNYVKNCLVGYIKTTAASLDKFIGNTAYENGTPQYSTTITNTISFSAALPFSAGVNLTVP